MMGKICVYLDNAQHPKAFRISENILGEIAREFQKEHPPQILYDITEDEENPEVIVTENKSLVAGRSYWWKLHGEKWQDKELVQNALFCSLASYDDRPLRFLKDNKIFHSVTLLIAADVYFDKQPASVFIANLEGTGSKKKSLIIAFRGAKTLKEVVPDFKIGFKTDLNFVGKIHGGFLEKMQSVSTDEIFELAIINKVDQVVTCGSSIGGAVSCLVHMKLLYDLENARDGSLIDPENVVNVTFGAPMIGNYELAKHVEEKRYARNMFHFAYVSDIVPIVLSVGHVFEVLKQNAPFPAKAVIYSRLQKIEPLLKLCLEVATSVVKNPEARNIQRALEALKAPPSTLQNEYTELNYVPIGKHLLIQKLDHDVIIERLTNNPKIVENVLQSAIDFSVKNSLDIRKFHSLSNYGDLIKSYFGGFIKSYLDRQRGLQNVPCREWPHLSIRKRLLVYLRRFLH